MSIDRMARPYVAPSGHPVRLLRPGGSQLRLGAWIATTTLLFGALWWFAAPPRLGGATSFVTVDGTSMLPKLRRDDLVVLRASSSYSVGDVVGYRSEMLGRVVLHRIVAIDHGRYTFKGDNNGFVDPERPTRASLVGKAWFHVPSAGRLVDSLRAPWIVGVLAAFLVLALGLGGGKRPEPSSNHSP